MNIMRVQWKIRFIAGGRVHEKLIYKGELCKKEGWTVCRFKGGPGEKEGSGVSERGWNPNAYYGATMVHQPVW